MNGVHDLGGMDGFGPVRSEKGEPIFHEPWERRVFGMLLVTMAQGHYNLDELRHGIERMSPAHYLGSTYYEHWLAGLERVFVEKGKLSAVEIAERVSLIARTAAPVPPNSNPGLVDALMQGVRVGAPTARGHGKPKFATGDAVRVRKMNPSGHTRCPRYVRGVIGKIHTVHEKFVFPDAHAHGRGESPQVLYTVGFDARDVWGRDAEGKGRVYVDLWQSYLEPAGETAAAPAKRPRARKAAAKPSQPSKRRVPGNRAKAPKRGVGKRR